MVSTVIRMFEDYVTGVIDWINAQPEHDWLIHELKANYIDGKEQTSDIKIFYPGFILKE